MDPAESTPIIFMNSLVVMRILKNGCLAQVADSVISTDAVDVVNLLLWEMSEHVKPREAMCLVFGAMNANFPIPTRLPIAGNATNNDLV